jgi:S1-C subfamily serine protease
VDVRLKLVVTNAHCVDFARTILLRKNGDHVQYEARLLAVSHQVDIAVLTVEEDHFWKDTIAIEFGNHCRMQQMVDVVGYPIGGDTISITRGVVSRIDWVPYAQSGGEGQVCVQVDAAINPGNSGGPVVSDGKLVGIAFQGMSNGEAANVGYIIPVTILLRLLDNFKDCASKMDSMPPLGPSSADDDSWTMVWPPMKKSIYKTPLVKLRKFSRFVVSYQTADNPYLRRAVNLPEHLTGVVLREIPAVSNLREVLKNNDVLVAIDGNNVGNEGRVVNTMSRTAMDLQYLVTAKLVGEPIKYTICRNGEVRDIETVTENPPKRTPLISKEPYVSYVMFAGIVFSPLAQDSNVTDNPIADLIVKNQVEYEYSKKHKEYTKIGQQIVVLSSILPHKLTIGYKASDLAFSPMYKVDGKEIENIYDLAKAIATAKGPLITFELCDSNCIVLPMAEGWEATW